MLHINANTIERKLFFKNSDPAVVYTCIGYGQDPNTGVNYVVGELWDAVPNHTKVATFLIKEITFVGKLS